MHIQQYVYKVNPLVKDNIDKLCPNPVQGSSSSNNMTAENLTNLIQEINSGVAVLINVPSKIILFYPACNADNKVGNDKWANCILNSNFKEQIKIYNDMFYNHTIPSLNKIDEESKKSIDIEALKEKFTSFTNKSLQFSNSFFNNNNTNTPSDMFGEFRKNVIEPLQNEISNLGNTKNKILISIKDDIQKHKDEVTSLERQKDNIATRLNSTQFVIGTLPLTLTQTIAGFPVALAIGFLICVTLLTSTIKLFEELRKDGHKKIALIAPLWIYPTGIRLNIIARFLVFSTPFILFIIAWCLIGYSFTLCPHNKDLLNIFGVHSECLNSYTDSFRIADIRISNCVYGYSNHY